VAQKRILCENKKKLCLLFNQDAALASLKSLNKNDITEVRAMQRPPDGVRMVIEAVCIMKSVKPKRITGDKVQSLLIILNMGLLSLVGRYIYHLQTNQ